MNEKWTRARVYDTSRKKNGEWHRGKFGASFHINFLKQKTASSIRAHFSMVSMAKCLVLSWDFVSSEMVCDGMGWESVNIVNDSLNCVHPTINDHIFIRWESTGNERNSCALILLCVHMIIHRHVIRNDIWYTDLPEVLSAFFVRHLSWYHRRRYHCHYYYCYYVLLPELYHCTTFPASYSLLLPVMRIKHYTSFKLCSSFACRRIVVSCRHFQVNSLGVCAFADGKLPLNFWNWLNIRPQHIAQNLNLSIFRIVINVTQHAHQPNVRYVFGDNLFFTFV